MALKGIIGSQFGFGAAPPGNMFRDIPQSLSSWQVSVDSDVSQSSAPNKTTTHRE